MSAFVITTSIRGSSRTQVWESSEPLALGHPFRWVMERSERGIRVRDLSGEVGVLRKDAVHEIPFDRINSGAELDLPQDLKLKIHPVLPANPIFENAVSGEFLRIYRCAGSWATESESLTNYYAGRASGKNVFAFRSGKSGSWWLKPSDDRLTLIQNGTDRKLQKGEAVEISVTDLAHLTFRYNPENGGAETTWRFGMTAFPEFVDRASELDATGIAAQDAAWFKRSMIGGAGLLALFILMSWFWPAPPKETELVPPQYTQILMPKPEKAQAQAAAESGSAAPIAKDAPEKVQKAAVVQAFRAKALTNAVNGLLKGGMTKLLAQSDFVSGTAQSAEARKILDTRNTALQPTTTLGSLTGAKNVQIASVGGDAHGEGGHNVGYGHGEHAAVGGQGKGFVPFVQADANGSIVDEGLTRDEVGEVIHRHLSEVRYCYESAMLREPDIEGKLMAAFVINGQGVVKTAEAKSSTLPDPRLDDCIIRRLVTWQFPKPRGGVDVAVTYPFIFKTLGR